MNQILDLKPNDRVVILSPHPDDEVLGTAGLIQKAIEQGVVVDVVEVTDGNRRGKMHKRKQEVSKALGILGLAANHLHYLDYPDGRLKQQAALKVQLISILKQFDPTVLIVSDPLDLHPDHAYLGQTAKQIFQEKLVPGLEQLLFTLIHFKKFPRPLGYKPKALLSPPKHIHHQYQWLLINLTDQEWERKILALKEYKSQLFTPFLRGLIFSFMRKNELFRLPDLTEN